MKVPTVGETIEDAGGSRWRVQGVHLYNSEAGEDYPAGWSLHIDVEPVHDRVPIPDSIRRGFDG